jgi:hypothetical protein|uniref:Lytic murein transglycosylase n=1 Tax=Chelativorans sp. (strain BNC1) TaxID=266779 RepID=Q11LA0_CHESB
MSRLAIRWHTPLCPAGHLPLKGGDQLAVMPVPNLLRCRLGRGISDGVIAPAEGEMGGSPEGGALSWAPLP